MPELINNGDIQTDHWVYLEKSDEPEKQTVPDGKVLIPLSTWLAQSDRLTGRIGADFGIWFDSDEEPETLGEAVRQFAVVGVNFPKFADGRGYSIARLLRERYGFTGDLRAIGDVLLDQLFYMKRCGFSSFALRPDRSAETALTGLATFQEVYQSATDQPAPLFRRRA